MHHDDPELRLPDRAKRLERNCESEDNENIAWDWAPELRRCPKSQLTDEVWMMYSWWYEWKMTDGALLPFGASSLAHEPAFVAETILICEHEMKAVEAYIAEQHKDG